MWARNATKCNKKFKEVVPDAPQDSLHWKNQNLLVLILKNDVIIA